MKHKITSLQIAQLFLIGFLLIITTDRFSSGVYTLLRILATIISVWSAIKTDNNILKLIFAFIAILFNPIILIKLDRNEWQLINLIVALFYAGNILYPIISKYRKTQKILTPPQADVKSDETLQSTQETKEKKFPEQKAPMKHVPIIAPTEKPTLKQRFLNLFRGRINRKEYICRSIVLLFALLFYALLLFSYYKDLQNTGDPFISLLLIIAIPLVFFVIPIIISVYSCSLQVKRLHDMNLSGWCVLPIQILGVILGNLGEIGGIIMIIFTLLFSCVPGTKGANKYGEQPK